VKQKNKAKPLSRKSRVVFVKLLNQPSHGAAIVAGNTHDKELVMPLWEVTERHAFCVFMKLRSLVCEALRAKGC